MCNNSQGNVKKASFVFISSLKRQKNTFHSNDLIFIRREDMSGILYVCMCVCVCVCACVTLYECDTRVIRHGRLIEPIPGPQVTSFKL